MALPHLTEDDILEHTDEGACARGRDYFRRGKVLSCRVNEGEIEGVVSGSGRNVYEQSICLSDDDDWLIDGSCTCPMEYNCKHVAAVMFAYLERQPARAAFPVPLSYASQVWLQGVV